MQTSQSQCRGFGPGIRVSLRWGFAMLIALLTCLPLTSGVAHPPSSRDDAFAQIAQAFAGDLKKEKVKRVVIIDLVGVNGRRSSFGAWLADRLSSANGWTGVDVVDRKAVAAQLSSFHAGDTNESYENRVKDLSLSQNAAVITGSYAPATDGVGVTLRSIAYRNSKPAHGVAAIRAKVAMSSEMKEHLPGPLESLAPAMARIYSEGEGGVSTCNCDGQNLNLQRTHAGVESGWATFTIVIGPDGQISNPSRCQSRGTLTDVLCRNLLDAPKTYGWTCKPALNVDGHISPSARSFT